MKVEFKKILGIDTLKWEHSQWMLELGIGSQFTVPWQKQKPITISTRRLPVEKRGGFGTPVFIDGVPGLIQHDHWEPRMTDVPAICIEFDADIEIDFHKLEDSDSAVRWQEQGRLENQLGEWAQVAYRALIRFLNAYRHAKCDISEEPGEALEQAVDITRPMHFWEFLEALLYEVSNGTSAYANCMPAGKIRSFELDNEILRSEIQKHLNKGTDFAQTRLLDARQLLYDGDTAMATVLAVMALEAKANEVLDAKLLKNENLNLGLKGFSTAKNQVDKLKEEASLLRRLVILMPMLARRPQLEMKLISNAIHARNDVIHKRAKGFKPSTVATWIQAIEQLTDLLNEQL